MFVLKDGVVYYALLSFLDYNALRYDVEAWDASPLPTQERKNKCVSVLSVHGLIDLLHDHLDRGLVSRLPVLYHVLSTDIRVTVEMGHPTVMVCTYCCTKNIGTLWSNKIVATVCTSLCVAM